MSRCDEQLRDMLTAAFGGLAAPPRLFSKQIEVSFSMSYHGHLILGITHMFNGHEVKKNV